MTTQASNPAIASSPGPREERVKVLLVDDQADNLLSAEAVLESLGEEIVKAESGRQALRYLLDDDFAVILLDIMMPGMDGFETAELIRQRERSRTTPIIFLTALGRSEEHIRRGYSLGAVDYILKPFVPEVLRSKVSVFIELSRKSALLKKQAAELERRNSELQQAIARSEAAEREVHALNRHLERRVQELGSLNQELEAFSYSVSHDLRGPLSRIAGFSAALLESYSGALDDTARLYLQRIDTSARRMCDLVDDLLNFSRITRIEMSPQRVELSEMVAAIAAELRGREPGRQVEFAIAPGVRASGDPNLMQAVLRNLLENAWKFTRRQPAASIEFGVLRAPEGPVCFVRDNGAGFDSRDAEKLFVPFRRLHAASDFEGTGIGLATVARIIQRHGGRVWAEAEVERGATFFFTLPSTEVPS